MFAINVQYKTLVATCHFTAARYTFIESAEV